MTVIMTMMTMTMTARWSLRSMLLCLQCTCSIQRVLRTKYTSATWNDRREQSCHWAYKATHEHR